MEIDRYMSRGNIVEMSIDLVILILLSGYDINYVSLLLSLHVFFSKSLIKVLPWCNLSFFLSVYLSVFQSVFLSLPLYLSLFVSLYLFSTTFSKQFTITHVVTIIHRSILRSNLIYVITHICVFSMNGEATSMRSLVFNKIR